jgi:hypothetical protein
MPVQSFDLQMLMDNKKVPKLELPTKITRHCSEYVYYRGILNAGDADVNGSLVAKVAASGAHNILVIASGDLYVSMSIGGVNVTNTLTDATGSVLFLWGVALSSVILNGGTQAVNYSLAIFK